MKVISQRSDSCSEVGYCIVTKRLQKIAGYLFFYKILLMDGGALRFYAIGNVKICKIQTNATRGQNMIYHHLYYIKVI